MKILLKRAYDSPAKSDGVRVLVDRLWPRGITKDDAKLKAWMRALAPSNELRKWYHERPTQWTAFRRKYLAELRAPEATAELDVLQSLAEQSATLTLVYASRNTERNNATVLKELLEGAKKPPATSGPVRAVAKERRAVRVRR